MNSVLMDPIPPEQLHSHFTQAATGAASEIKSFAQTMEDGRTRDVMEKAKESKANNVEDIAGWLVVEHEDWLDTRHDGASEDVDKKGEVSDPKVFIAGSTSEDFQGVLEKFKESHPGIEVSLEDTTSTVKVWTIGKAVRLPFMLLGLSTSTSPHSFRSPTQHRWGERLQIAQQGEDETPQCDPGSNLNTIKAQGIEYSPRTSLP